MCSPHVERSKERETGGEIEEEEGVNRYRPLPMLRYQPARGTEQRRPIETQRSSCFITPPFRALMFLWSPHRWTTADVMACTHPTSSARALQQALCECVSVRVHVRWARGRGFCFAGSALCFRGLAHTGGRAACGSSSSPARRKRFKVTGPRPSVCRGLFIDIVILDSRLSALVILLQTGYHGGPAAVLRGGLHQESLPGRQPAHRPSSAYHAEGGGKLPTFSELLQMCSKRNCTQNEENSCHLDVRGWFFTSLQLYCFC